MKKLLLASTATFLLMAKDAVAGPVAAGIGALLTTTIGTTGITVGSIALGIVSMGAQWLISKLLAPEVEEKGVKTKMETGGDTSPSFILGEYATAGKLAYANVWDGGSTPNSCLTYVIVLSCLPANGISSYVYINNERCTIDWGDVDADGFASVNEYEKNGGESQYCQMKFYDGTQTVADPWLRDKFGSDADRPFESDMKFTGCAYVIVQCWWSSKGHWTGTPQFRFVLEGAPLYDPREDSSVGGSGSQRWGNQSTWQFTKNAKVIEYNVIRGIKYDGERVWGGDASAYQLPLDYWFAAMNVCDENVTKANDDVIKRYEVGCEIQFEDKPIEIVDQINKSCSGYTTEYGGTFKTWCGGPGLSIATITDADFVITADMETNRFQPRQNTYNTAYGTYPEPREQWEVKEAPRHQDEDALAEDGEELAIEIQLPFVSENNQVQRVLRAAVRDSRRQLMHSGQMAPEAFILEPNDRVTFESDYFGYGGSGKDFLISAKEDLPNVNQQITLREINPNDTTWLTAYELDHRVGALTVVKPGSMDLAFTVSADQIDGANGKDRPAILIEWDWNAIDIDVESIKWELRRSGTTKVIKEGNIRNPEDGERTIFSGLLRFGKTYEVRLKPKPFGKRESSWTSWTSVTMTGIATPSAPSLTRVSNLADDGTLDFFVDVDWSAVDGEVAYVVRVVSDGTTRYYRTDEISYRFPATSGKSYVVAVRAVGADGGTKGSFSSTTSITVTKKNTAPTTPSGLAATGQLRRVKLAWTKSPDADFRRTIIYRSTTNDFTTASEVGRVSSNWAIDDGLATGTTYYYWITHEDRSGNESAKHPTSNTAGVSATTITVSDGDTDATAPSTPSAPTLAQVAKDVDEDGKVDIAVKVTWSAATGAKSYELEITQGSDVTYVKTKNRSHIFKAQSNKLYSVKIASVSFNGTSSVFSSATTITPSKKSATPATPGGVTATAKPKAVRIAWTAATEADFKWARIYRNTTNNSGTATAIGRTKSDWHRDDDDLEAGTTYYYWVAFIDTSGNEGSKSSVASATFRPVSISDTGVNDLTVLAENNDLALGTYGWGSASTIASDAANSYGPEYVFKRTSTGDHANGNVLRFPVRAGEQYYIGGMLKTSAGFTTTGGVGWRLSYRDSAGAEVSVSNMVGLLAVNTTWTFYGGLVTVPATAGIVTARLDWVVYGQTGGTVYGSHCVCRAAVSEDMTDQTAPSTPSAPSLTQVAKDVDEDGKVDIAIKATWSAVTGAKQYELEITQGSDVSYVVAKGLSHIFKAKSAKLYSVKVRALSFNGTPSSLSSATTLTPSKKSTVPSTPGGVTATAKAKKIVIGWTASTEADFKWARVWRHTSNSFGSATAIGKTKADRFVDDEDLAADTTYYYWVTFVDTSGNEGTNSSVASATWRKAVASDRVAEDTSNGSPDPELEDLSIWTSGGTGTLTKYATSLTSASRNRIGNPDSTGTTYIYLVPDYYISVQQNVSYYIEALVGGFTSNSATYVLSADWYSMDGSGVLTNISSPTVQSRVGNAFGKLSGIVTAPSTARRLRIRVSKTSNATAGDLSIAGLIVRKATDTALMEDASVTEAKTTTGAPGTPSTPSVAQIAKDLNGDGTVDMGFKVTWSAVTNSKYYVLEVAEYQSDNTTLIDTFYYFPKKSSFKFQVVADRYYRVKVASVGFNGNEGSFSSATTLQATRRTAAIETYSLDVVARLGYVEIDIFYDIGGVGYRTPPEDYLYSEIYYASNSSWMSASRLWQGPIYDKVRVPFTGEGDYYFRVQHTSRSGAQGALFPSVGSLAEVDFSPTLAKISAYNSGSISLSAATWTTIATDTSLAREPLFYMSFRNNDGTTNRRFDVRLQINGTTVFSQDDNQVNEGAVLTLVYQHTSDVPLGQAVTLQVKCANATAVNQRVLASR